MADFDYLVIDTAGHEKRGHIAADSIEQARIRLDRRRMYVVRIEPAPAPPGAASRSSPACRSAAAAWASRT